MKILGEPTKRRRGYVDFDETDYEREQVRFVGTLGVIDNPVLGQYAGQLVRTNEALFRREFHNILTTGGNFQTLYNNINGINGVTRADAIIKTVFTDMMAQSQQHTYRRAQIDKNVWNTRNDNRVCPVCDPLNQREATIGDNFSGNIDRPPVHVGCRCFLAPKMSKEQAEKLVRNILNKPAAVPAPVPTPENNTENIELSKPTSIPVQKPIEDEEEEFLGEVNFRGNVSELGYANMDLETLMRLFTIDDNHYANVEIFGGREQEQIIIEGNILQKVSDKVIVEVTRTLKPEEKSAHLDVLALDDDIVSSQAGGKMGMKIAHAWYRELHRLGYEKVDLMASLTIGRYAWAKQGFDYADEGHLEEIVKKKLPQWLNVKGFLSFELPELKSASDVANLKHPEGIMLKGEEINNNAVDPDLEMHIGKAFMLDMGRAGHGWWNGEMMLDDWVKRNPVLPKQPKTQKNTIKSVNGLNYLNTKEPSEEDDSVFWSEYLTEEN